MGGSNDYTTTFPEPECLLRSRSNASLKDLSLRFIVNKAPDSIFNKVR